MSVGLNLPITSSMGFGINLPISSTVDPIAHAGKDLALTSGVAQPGFSLDLAIVSAAARYGGSGGRARRRRAGPGVSS